MPGVGLECIDQRRVLEAFCAPCTSSHALTWARPITQGNGRSSWPRGLILAPTRELVQQIFDEARKFCYKTGLRCAVAYGGGENMRDQLRCVLP